MHEDARLFAALLQRDTVKALSFTDPWGSLVARGAKRIETRSWSTSWCGPVAIHVARRLPDDLADLCQSPHFYEVLAAEHYRDHQWHFPTGHVIAIALLDEVQRTEHVRPSEREQAFGNFAPGRYAWQFSAVYRLPQPVPVRGSLGLWDWQPPLAFWETIQQAHDALCSDHDERRFERRKRAMSQFQPRDRVCLAQSEVYRFPGGEQIIQGEGTIEWCETRTTPQSNQVQLDLTSTDGSNDGQPIVGCWSDEELALLFHEVEPEVPLD